MKTLKQTHFLNGLRTDLNEVEQKSTKQVFKPYSQNQEMLLPKRIIEMIPSGHICFIISEIIDRMDISLIVEKYNGGGASAYDPKMMLKEWILGFVNKIYSCRALAKNLRENVVFIWMSGNQEPDYHTLNNFRLRLKDDIKAIFRQIVLYALDAGIIKGEDLFVDHTKKEANANKHKIIWAKQVDKRLKKIDEDIDALFKHIDELNEKEDKIFGGKDLPEMERKGFDKDKVKEIVDKINKNMKEKKINRQNGIDLRRSVKKTGKLLENKVSYLAKKALLGKKRSCSRTDSSAVAMMMKDKLSVKPAYNEGIAVEKGIVINYVISDNCNDSTSFIPLLQGAAENLGSQPISTTADSAYGSEESYSYLEKNNIDCFVKFNSFHNEKSFAWRNKKLRFDDFVYDSAANIFSCKNDKILSFVGISDDITKSGYVRKVNNYRACETDCCTCPLKEKCTDAKARTLGVSWEGERLKELARQNLNSKRGIELRKRRGNEVESVFGDEKLNKHHHRYLLRGIEKVNLEAGLIYIAHNIRKIHSLLNLI